MSDAAVDLEAGAAEEPLLEPPPRRLYPDPFFCSITNEVMTTPVVGADGSSFEKSAVLKRDAESDDVTPTYYPNRALESIIDKEKHRIGELGTVRGALERAEASVRAGFQQILEKSALPSGAYHPLPEAYYCSITLDLISRAALDPDGHSYERQAIEGWIRANGTSPLTREPLSAAQLRDNHALDDLIDAEVNRPDDALHPSFRRWRESRIEYDDSVATATAPSQEAKDAGEAAPSPFPTTQEEIDELSSGKWKCTSGALFFLFIAGVSFTVVFIPAEFFFFVLFGLLYCSCAARRM